MLSHRILIFLRIIVSLKNGRHESQFEDKKNCNFPGEWTGRKEDYRKKKLLNNLVQFMKVNLK